MAATKKMKQPSEKKIPTVKVKISKRKLGDKAKLQKDPKQKIKGKGKSHQKKAMLQKRGVVYFSHLPHGFYEEQLKGYCSQFGAVTGVHVPRSIAGNSKGYAFVEFKHPEVANVVAETMNNYLMFNRLVKAEVVPLERQKPWIFSNGVNPVKVARKRQAERIAALQRTLTPEEEETYKKKSLKKVQRTKKKLEKLGYSYEFEVAS